MINFSQITKKSIHFSHYKGFALPTVLIASIIMLSVLLVSVSSTASIRVSLVTQFYNSLSQNAGDAGAVYAKSCLDANGGTITWTTAKPLRPYTDCTGTLLVGIAGQDYTNCSNISALPSANPSCYISVNDTVASTFTVEYPTGGIASDISSVGSAKLLRSNNSVWRQYITKSTLIISSSAVAVVNTNVNVSTLVIGGGGGGGYAYYGGGGGGGQLRSTTLSISSGTFSVTVGGGGIAGATGRGTNGGDSIFSTITSIGGGGGGGGSISGLSAQYPGLYGGNGGGAAEQNTGGSAPTGGFSGGSGGLSAWAGNGGGGAGGIGGYVTSAGYSGVGGVGVSSSISGALAWYSGGGGGGGRDGGGAGGNGGGGNGAFSSTAATSGSSNTGGGGGGSRTAAAANGGSGIVIISYPTGSVAATGGTITTSGGNTIHTFNSSGIFTVGTTYGTGADGVITVASAKNLNTEILATGRTCADAINYSVTALTTNSATVSSAPAAGCLVAGDEILLINLQGISTNYANVGNYESVRVLSVSGTTITFSSNKTKYYGNGVSDDLNIGVATTNQRVMLQRVPNYTNVTVNSGIALNAAAWDGTKGGVLAFRANGTTTVNGSILTSGLGWRGGVGGLNYGGSGESYNGGPIAESSTSVNANGGGGGGGSSCNIYDGQTGGAGGPGYAVAGTNGGLGRYQCRGLGGASYGDTNLSKLYFGSGGGGNAGLVVAGKVPGGNGAGIIYIVSDSLTVSGYIKSNGADSTLVSYEGASGGSGGSIYLKANSINIGSSLVQSNSGLSGNGVNWSSVGPVQAQSGPSSAGRIAIYYKSSISGSTSPSAYQITF
ncbi:MAG: glycine-rich domain-containing protein [Candidatus Saccharibacteria bacterium]